MIEIIPCGTHVRTTLSDIPAMITAVSIRFDKINYEVSYFLEGDYKAIWLHESEFLKHGNYQKEAIGFKKSGQ